jgi:hypothetical protein
VSRIVAMKPRIAGTNDRALNVPCPYMLIPTQVVITSGDVPPISRAINGSRWHCPPKPRHVRSRSSSRASRAGQVRDGDAAVRHWVMELPYVTIRRRRGSSGRQTRASSGTSRPSRRA